MEKTFNIYCDGGARGNPGPAASAFVAIDNNKVIEARTVIISTGASAKYLGLPSEQRLRGGGVSACAVCDGFFYKGQDVAIVGGGDTAAEEASYLANICNKVTMLIRKDYMRASKAMQHRVQNLPNVDIRFNTEVDEILGDQVVEGLRMVNNQTGEKEEIAITGFFVAIGHKPNTDIFKGQLEMDSTGYLITKGKSTKTNKPGVFASGDVQDKEYRQAVTAAGTGCMAALDAERYLARGGFFILLIYPFVIFREGPVPLLVEVDLAVGVIPQYQFKGELPDRIEGLHHIVVPVFDDFDKLILGDLVPPVSKPANRIVGVGPGPHHLPVVVHLYLPVPFHQVYRIHNVLAVVVIKTHLFPGTFYGMHIFRGRGADCGGGHKGYCQKSPP